MKSDIVIKVENLSKKYVIGEKENFPTLRDHIVNLPKKIFSSKKPKEFWALKNVSFEVKKGEVLGIIGRNGAGKSTLLKILSRITDPTTGKIVMSGKVASLLEVGTGFNPELSGRENIYLNGSIIGMSRKEIDDKFEEIVEFSGVKEFLDTPVKRYSSGMHVRLAFSVSAFLESDILIVDEVLAVGDAEFQKRCLQKINNLAGSGRTVIFVSHSLATVQNLCQKVLLLENGKVKKYGNSQKVINQYTPKPKDAESISTDLSTVKLNRLGDKSVKFTKVSIYNEKHNAYIKSGEDIWVEFDYIISGKFPRNRIKDLMFSFPLINSFNGIFADFNTQITNYRVTNEKLKGKLKCKIPKLPLAPGIYSINAYCALPGQLCDWITDCHFINVRHGNFFSSGNIPKVGWMLIDHSWSEDL